MRQKTAVFASQGALDATLGDTDFVTGMVAGTVAMAEDVNTYGNRSDKQLKIVSDELCNAITDQGVALDNNDNSQLSYVLKEKISTSSLLTGIVYDSVVTTPSLFSNRLSFSGFKVQFNNKVFYGSGQSDFTTVDVPAQTISATAAWGTGARFIYVDKSGTIQYQDGNVLAEEGDEKCLLGSVFVINGQMQQGSWAYTPWIQQSSIATRSAPTAQTKGGLISPKEGLELSVGSLQIFEEGINFSANKFNPNIKTILSSDTLEYKLLYIGYNPSASSITTITTNKFYNTETGLLETIPSDVNGFIVLVPCVTPTGQYLMIPPMGASYDRVVYPTQSAAESAVFSMRYELGDVADRVIYLGQSIVVKVNATDVTDGEQFEVYGSVPQSLAGFTNQGGQTGGGVGEYVPMREFVHTSAATISMFNWTSNIINGSANFDTTVLFPTPETGKLNQFEIKFSPNTDRAPGIVFPSSVLWWSGQSVDIVPGYSYTFVFEYDRLKNRWVGGALYV